MAMRYEEFEAEVGCTHSFLAKALDCETYGAPLLQLKVREVYDALGGLKASDEILRAVAKAMLIGGKIYQAGRDQTENDALGIRPLI